MTRATVIVPTHDHPTTVDLSVRSLLDQTHPDLEVLVVCDGVGDDTRGVLEQFGDDDRVVVLDEPKGPRHGEVHRDRALREVATGEVVIYLSDDDLAFPSHVAMMVGLLTGEEGADFASALPLVAELNGSFRVLSTNLGNPFWREKQAHSQRWGRVSLSCGAHTMAAYRSLPVGWSTTPAGTATDFAMWRKFLVRDDVAATTATWPTMVHLPTGAHHDDERRDWTPEQRRAELVTWWDRSRDPHRLDALEREVVGWLVRDRATRDAQLVRHRNALRRHRAAKS